jgi:hypothetical protein
MHAATWRSTHYFTITNMNSTLPTTRFARLAGILAIVAAPLAWGSLVVGVGAVGGDFAAFEDPQRLLGLGSAAAPLIRASFLLSMFGSYLFLLPLALAVYDWLRPIDPPFARWCTLCGVGYLALGAAGAAILAAVWPLLMTIYPGSSERSAIALSFATATAIAEDGLQGIIQNIAGAVWWIGIGWLLWRRRRVLAMFTLLLGALVLLNALGNAFGSEALSTLGLLANVLLAPLWGAWIGIVLLRLRT